MQRHPLAFESFRHCLTYLALLSVLVAGMDLFANTSAAQVSAPTEQELLDALTGRPKVRGADPPGSGRSMTDDERAFLETLGHRSTRGLAVEERKRVWDTALTRPGIDMEVQFGYNSAALSPAAEEALSRLGRALTHPQLSSFTFLIAGHTDATGGYEFNLDLSERRAASVKQFLVDQYDLKPTRLIAIGYGFEQLKMPSDPFAAENRRVRIVNMGSLEPSHTPGHPPPKTGPKSGTVQVLGQLAGASVEVAIVPGETVKLGDLLSVRIKSRIAGSLMVYDQDANGQTTQIFPNSLSAGALPGETRMTIAAGETIVLPGPADRFQLRVSPPVGASRIIAIVLPRVVAVDDLTRPHQDMRPIPKPDELFQELARRTRGVRIEATDKAVGIAEYMVVP